MSSIVIDAGHGGTKIRGRSTPGLSEKELVLAIAQHAGARLGGRALLTRDRDVNLSFGERIAVARNAGAKAFVSIHKSDGPTDEIYVHSRASAPSIALAHTIAAKLGGSARILSADLAVLSPERHFAGTAACLVEFSDARGVDRYGRAIADALKVWGTNDMKLVADPTAIPYRYIARLEVGWKTKRAHGRMFGTGTLIWPNMILTAGHNLRREFGEYGRGSAVADQIKISLPGIATPCSASGWWAHERWLNAADDAVEAEYDYGLIKTKVEVGDKLVGGELLRSWSTGKGTSFDRLDPAKIVDVHVAGFPTKPCVEAVGGTYPAMLESSGTARASTTVDRVFGYDADTCAEQSGGPVWIEDEGLYTFVGVHHGTWNFQEKDGGLTELNNATRLTREMLNQIDQVFNHGGWRTEGP